MVESTGPAGKIIDSFSSSPASYTSSLFIPFVLLRMFSCCCFWREKDAFTHFSRWTCTSTSCFLYTSHFCFAMVGPDGFRVWLVCDGECFAVAGGAVPGRFPCANGLARLL